MAPACPGTAKLGLNGMMHSVGEPTVCCPKNAADTATDALLPRVTAASATVDAHTNWFTGSQGVGLVNCCLKAEGAGSVISDVVHSCC